MKKSNEKQATGLPEIALGLDDLIRRGARQVIEQAIEAELAQFLDQYENVKTLTGNRAVVRNGYLPEREVLTAIGPVAVKVPKVDRPVGLEEVDQCRIEAKKVARLRHPNIVPVHDVGKDGGSAVSPDYQPGANAFNGKVKGVQLSIAEDDGKHVVDPADAIRVALARQ